jgi:hypothetical protein
VGQVATLGGRRGRATSSPPQLGHRPARLFSHAAQNVHSKEQMRAFAESGGRSLLHRSQLGRISSIGLLQDDPESGRMSSPTGMPGSYE